MRPDVADRCFSPVPGQGCWIEPDLLTQGREQVVHVNAVPEARSLLFVEDPASDDVQLPDVITAPGPRASHFQNRCGHGAPFV